jgi:hypothetical protein
MSEPKSAAQAKPSIATPKATATAKLGSKKADAVLIPVGWTGQTHAVDQHGYANRVLAPLCGAKQLWFFAMGQFRLGIPYRTGNPVHDFKGRDSLYFEVAHPLAMQPRYKWFAIHKGPSGDWGIVDEIEDDVNDLPELAKSGFLRSVDVDADDPQVIESAAEHRAKRTAEFKAKLAEALDDPAGYKYFQTRTGMSDEAIEAMRGFYDRAIV